MINVNALTDFIMICLTTIVQVRYFFFLNNLKNARKYAKHAYKQKMIVKAAIRQLNSEN
jgi:hypothetical protein